MPKEPDQVGRDGKPLQGAAKEGLPTIRHQEIMRGFQRLDRARQEDHTELVKLLKQFNQGEQLRERLLVTMVGVGLFLQLILVLLLLSQ